MNIFHLFKPGNGFFGSLSSRGPSSHLQEIYLSHNHILGAIPDDFINPAVLKLHISNNRISHGISKYHESNTSNSESELELIVNRLSGNVPKTTRKLKNRYY